MQNSVSADATSTKVGFYPWYVVVVCMLAYLFSFVDRQVLTLLIEPIQRDLDLSDTEFGLLHGFAFALFYATMGIPVARLADQHSRPLIISVGIVVWSLATVACGMAKTFGQFFLARMSVGVGECVLSPSVYSMLSDYFPKEKLGKAVGVFSVGSFLGAGLAYLIGAYVIDAVKGVEHMVLPVFGEVRAWQIVFFIVGFPGILVGILMGLTVRDPQRKGMATTADGKAAPVSFREVLRYVMRYKWAYGTVYAGFTLAAMALYVVMSWTPAHYLRNHGMTAAEVGYFVGVVTLLTNTTGVLTSGWMTDWFTRRGYREAGLIVGVIAGLALIPPICLYTTVTDLTLSKWLLVPTVFFAAFPMSSSTVAMQLLTPNQMRAQVTAFFLFFNNLIGLGVGVALVGLLNDFAFGADTAVRYSQPIVAGGASLLSAVILFAGRKAYLRAMDETRF